MQVDKQPSFIASVLTILGSLIHFSYLSLFTFSIVAAVAVGLVWRSSRRDNLVNVKSGDWKIADDYFLGNPDQVKCDKKSNHLFHSFINVNNELYAIKEKPPLGIGGEGKVKIVQNRQYENFKVKIEGRGLRGTDDPELQVMQRLEIIKGQAERAYNKVYLKEYSEKKLYTIMEYIEGENLDKNLNKIKACSHDKKLMFAIKAAEALKVLHDKRIIHADVKPENIICKIESDEISMRFIDFGFSRILPPRKKYNIDVWRGTREFMAPEISNYTEDHDVRISMATDIYALAIMYKNCFNLEMSGNFYSNMLAQKPHLRLNIDQVLSKLYCELSKTPRRSP